VEFDYEKSSVSSIVEFSRRLSGKSLAEVVFIPREIVNSTNKGDLGSLVEAFFFGHKPGNEQGPDFPEAGLELKTTGVIQDSKKRFRAKERLVLTMVNFETLVEEEWATSSLLSKCGVMLILFYLYEKDRPVVDRRFVLEPMLHRMLERDWRVIQADWEKIRQMVRDGKAHELSEGDTLYLSACRKGAGGEREALRKQPFSPQGAKSRAFSLKPSYINVLIQGHPEADVLGLGHTATIEDAIARRLERFIGLAVDEIAEVFEVPQGPKGNKGFHRQLVLKMLAAGGNSVPELDKAGVELKTVRLTASGRPRESMSFPGFKFMGIVDEVWEESVFFEKLEKKFLLMAFQPDVNGKEIFIGAMLWNMPFQDRLEAKRVWEETRRRVIIDATDLPKISESSVAHVRPKGKNGADVIPTPQGGYHLRQAFWLNATYIGGIISSSLQTS
jgi:DNA mismatch repair protein MutH